MNQLEVHLGSYAGFSLLVSPALFPLVYLASLAAASDENREAMMAGPVGKSVYFAMGAIH